MAKHARSSAVSLPLDQLDLALVAQLQQAGRTPLTELAARLGVSHGTVRNRLERLLSARVLRVVATVDPAKVGFPAQVLIGIHGDLHRMAAIEKQLAEFEEVTFVSTLTGRLDFVIGAVFVSDAALRDFLVNKLSTVKGIRGTETFHVLNLGKRLWQWEIPVQSHHPARELRRGRRSHRRRSPP
ncbi:MAG: Lrp/AsnC family transcriptional regulator [Armatimonadetes bacterium]|nr:Lrp/AsnC family transcriptional regulator [Armatimonadota bacterium]